MIPPAPPITGACAHSRVNTGKEGKFPLESQASAWAARFIFNKRNMWQTGEVSGSDVARSCVSSACLPAFIPVGLLPVCASHVYSSGA